MVLIDPGSISIFLCEHVLRSSKISNIKLGVQPAAACPDKASGEGQGQPSHRIQLLQQLCGAIEAQVTQWFELVVHLSRQQFSQPGFFNGCLPLTNSLKLFICVSSQLLRRNTTFVIVFPRVFGSPTKGRDLISAHKTDSSAHTGFYSISYVF